MNEQMVTVFNPGPIQVNNFVATRKEEKTYVVNVEDNQCVDLPTDVANVLLKAFPHLAILALPDMLEIKAKKAEKREMSEAPVDTDEPKCICSNCGYEAKNKAGLSMHLRRKH